MEQQDQQSTCNHLGSNNPDCCHEAGTCPDTDRCSTFYWLEKYGFRKLNNPPDWWEYLIENFSPAVDEAWEKYPGEDAYPKEGKVKYPGDEKQANNREKLIIFRLKKASEEYARAIKASARKDRKEADRKDDEAISIRRSEPKGEGRFPPGWMRDVSKECRGARELMNLLILIKEVAKREKSDQLTDQLVASGRAERKDLAHHYTDKNEKKRSWPAALFQMDYERAMYARGWKQNKVNRLLRQACKAGVIYPMAKSPAENGQMVYCSGVWQSGKGMSWIRWLCKGNDYWISVFRDFKCT